MENKRLIRIANNKVFLTDDMFLEMSQTSLVGEHLRFKTVHDIYFEVDVIAYNKNTKEITLEVVNYQPKNIEGFKEQTAKATVSFIYFNPLKWTQLERHLGSYTKNILMQTRIVEDDGNSIPIFSQRKQSGELNDGFAGQYGAKSMFAPFEAKPPIHFAKQDPVFTEITEEAKISFKIADFNKGFVAFSYRSKELNKEFNLKIENPFLLKEFNTIKSYFPKAFGGSKQFSITVSFTLRDQSVTSIVTRSAEIEAINASVIECIKHERIAKLTTTPSVLTPNKSLYTTEEIFDIFNSGMGDEGILKQSEDEILNYLIEVNKVRNAKHLQFLSGSKQSGNQKLRFTLKPLFGFLFFIEGQAKHHFCWELLKSHATYVWSFDRRANDINIQYKRVEETINLIREAGREAYRSGYKSRIIDKDLAFCVIDHNNINSGSKESFVVWKNKLNEVLV